jgi:hypothetical protein
MSVDSLFRGTSAQVYTRHPNGSFTALVKDIAIADTENGKRFLKLEMVTSEGKVPEYRIYMISEGQALQAEHDSRARESLIKQIQFNKGILVRLELVDEATVKGFGQNEMIKTFAMLKGKSLEIKVEDDPRTQPDGTVRVYQKTLLEKVIAKQVQPQAAPASNSGFAENLKSIAKTSQYSLDDVPF